MMDEKIDRLFIEKDCPHCGVIRAELNMNAVNSVDFKGKDGQSLRVFSTFSNEASKELLEKFGLAGKWMPVILTWEGEIRADTQQILAWMRKHGMSTVG